MTTDKQLQARELHDDQGLSYAKVAQQMGYKSASGARAAVLAGRAHVTQPGYTKPQNLGTLFTPYGSIAIKGTGNPLLDAFHGISSGDESDFPDTAEGMAKAFAACVWAYRCVKIRAQTLAAIPLEIVNKDDEPIPNHPLSKIFCDNNTRLMRDTESDMQVYGRAYWGIGNTARRYSPLSIKIVADIEGIKYYEQTLEGRVITTFEPRDMVYFRDYDPRSDLGSISPMSYALGNVGVLVNVQTFTKKFFENGAILSGLFSTDQTLTKTDLERIKEQKKNEYDTVKNAHKDMWLWGGLTYTPMSAPLKDLVMRELREDERREIAAAFGVPMSIAQIADPALYAAKQDYANFHTLTVLPELDLLVDEINRQWIAPRLGENVKLVANTESVEALQEDLGEITTRNAAGVSAGYVSLNEAREREGLDPLPQDVLIIAGKPVLRSKVEAGDLSDFVTPEPLSPFGLSAEVPPQVSVPAQPLQLPAQVPGKSMISVVINNAGEDKTVEIIEDAFTQQAIQDIKRWQRKVTAKGVQTPFTSDYIPSSIAAFLRNDLLAWDGESERQATIKTAFDRALAALKATDEDTATPEEFEDYWHGIETLFDTVSGAFAESWTDLPAKLAAWLRNIGQTGAEMNLDGFLSSLTDEMVSRMVGTQETPGALTSVFLAGAARGNDILQRELTRASKDAGLTISWQVVNQLAVDWAKQYGYDLVRGINGTTAQVFQTKISEWINGGGSLEDLAKYIEGDLSGLTIPANWTPGKMNWATSRERARLIAQTETTRAYAEGSIARWAQAGVTSQRWRTNRDIIVCPICRGLNNVVGNQATGWTHKETGQVYKMPAHVGDRCFLSPVVVRETVTPLTTEQQWQAYEARQEVTD